MERRGEIWKIIKREQKGKGRKDTRGDRDSERRERRRQTPSTTAKA